MINTSESLSGKSLKQFILTMCRTWAVSKSYYYLRLLTRTSIELKNCYTNRYQYVDISVHFCWFFCGIFKSGEKKKTKPASTISIFNRKPQIAWSPARPHSYDCITWCIAIWDHFSYYVYIIQPQWRKKNKIVLILNVKIRTPRQHRYVFSSSENLQYSAEAQNQKSFQMQLQSRSRNDR